MNGVDQFIDQSVLGCTRSFVSFNMFWILVRVGGVHRHCLSWFHNHYQRHMLVYMSLSVPNNDYIMCSFHSETTKWLVKRLTHDFEIETSSVNEAHNHSTTSTSGNSFRPSWKLIPTNNNKSWKCEILEQMITISVVTM